MNLRLRNPRYTGQSRCWPCTVLNVGFVLLSGIILTTVVNTVIALSVITVGLAGVWYRGYFIPGTPWLSQQLPESVQSWFGTHDSAVNSPAAEALIVAQVLTTDFNLTTDADEIIRKRSSTYVDDPEALGIAVTEHLNCATNISINRRLGGGERWFVFDDNKRTIRQWKERQIAALDIASTTLLSERIPDWQTRSETEKQTMLALIRYGVSDCPNCGTPFTEPDSPQVVCCGGRSLIGERQCEVCDYALVDRNHLPSAVLEGEATTLGENTMTETGM